MTLLIILLVGLILLVIGIIALIVSGIGLAISIAGYLAVPLAILIAFMILAKIIKGLVERGHKS